METIIKTIIKLLMSLATEEIFKAVFLLLAEEAANSTKTDFDNKLIARITAVLRRG